MSEEVNLIVDPEVNTSEAEMSESFSRVRKILRTSSIETGNDADTQTTEEGPIRRNVVGDEPEGVCNSGIKAVKVEIKSKVEMPDGNVASEVEISVQSASEDDVEGGESASEGCGPNASGEVSDDSVAALSNRVEIHSEDGFHEEAGVTEEVVDVPLDDDEEEFVDASNEMPEVQIDASSTVSIEAADNLEEMLPDVPDFEIELPEIEHDTDTNVTDQESARRKAGVRGNRQFNRRQEIDENSDDTEDEQVRGQVLDENEVGEGPETPENRKTNLGDIIASALGGIPYTSSRNCSSGSSNETAIVVIEENVPTKKDEKVVDENENGNHCLHRAWEVVAKSGVRFYIFIQEKVFKKATIPKMTIMRAWTITAFVTGTVPCYVGYSKENRRFELKSWAPQKMFCLLQHALATAEAISSLQNISIILNGTISPYTFIQLGGVLASCVNSLVFTKACFFDMNKLLDYENATLGRESGPVAEENAPTPSIAEENKKSGSKKITIFSFLSFLLFLGFMLASSSITQLRAFDQNWNEGGVPAVALQTYACHGRKRYQWKNSTTCGLDWLADEIHELPADEILWGIFGMISFASSKITENQRHLVISACNMAFFMDSWQAEGATITDATLISIYDALYTKTKHISRFGGLLLLSELAEVAFRLPSWSSLILRGDTIKRIRLLLLLTQFFGFVTLGCVGTWTSDTIRKAMSGPRGYSSLPPTAKATAIFFVHLYQHPIGIGIFGLVAVNFAFIAGYMSTVGSFVMMLYEAENNDCVKNK